MLSILYIYIYMQIQCTYLLPISDKEDFNVKLNKTVSYNIIPSTI